MFGVVRVNQKRFVAGFVVVCIEKTIPDRKSPISEKLIFFGKALSILVYSAICDRI